MNVADVMDQIAERVRTISGLRKVYEYEPASVSVTPSVFLPMPEDYTFDETYQRGYDRMRLPLVLMVARPTDRTARDRIAEFLSGSGDSSIKQVVDSGPSNTYEGFDVTVTSMLLTEHKHAGSDYLAAIFSLDVAMTGA